MSSNEIPYRPELGRPLVYTASDSTTNTWLAAALAAIGIAPDLQRPLTAVVAEGRSGPRVTWYFAPRSLCGKYDTGAMIKAWDDPTFSDRNPEHPLAYLKCGFQNHARLVDLIKRDTPLLMVRRNGKVAFVRRDTPERETDRLFRLL